VHQSVTMEVPRNPLVYNGAQRRGAVAGAMAVASDIEVVPDTEDEASIHAQGSTIADIHAMSYDMDLDFEEEVSGQPVQVNVVARSCDTVKGKDASEHALVPNDDACAKVPVTPSQWYDPTRKSETSGRHSRQSESETSGTMYQRRIHNSGMRGSGEQRRSVEDLRAELTEELRFQQAMFLSARDHLAAQQHEAIEGLRGDVLRIVNENRLVQPSVAQVGVPSASQTEMRKHEEVSQLSHQAVVAQVVPGDRMSVRSMGSDDRRGQSRGGASVDVALGVGPHHEPMGPCSQYELGGPGIPQVMTGGMPSGVPPGVYATPEVALTQYPVNSESQMITGGMPSGIPSGIYRTPVDAMCQSLVNRQLMTSQLVVSTVQTCLRQWKRRIILRQVRVCASIRRNGLQK